MLKEARMIDINTYKKEKVKEEVKDFALNTSVIEFHAII